MKFVIAMVHVNDLFHKSHSYLDFWISCFYWSMPLNSCDDWLTLISICRLFGLTIGSQIEVPETEMCHNLVHLVNALKGFSDKKKKKLWRASNEMVIITIMANMQQKYTWKINLVKIEIVDNLYFQLKSNFSHKCQEKLG